MLFMTELSAGGYPARLVAAMSAWEVRCKRVGRGGNQSELHRQMAEQFGTAAPSRSAVSKWLRTMVPPEPQYGEILAAVLGVRPAWLYFNDGPMTQAEILDDEERKRAYLEEQGKRYPKPKRDVRRVTKDEKAG